MMQPPKAPEKPLSAYMRFSKKQWDSVRTEHPDLKLWEIGTIIGQKWRNLRADEKKEYQDAWNVDKSNYDVEIAAYRNSPEYKNYLKAKSEEQAQQTASTTNIPTAASPTPPPVGARLPTEPAYVPSPPPAAQVLPQQLLQQQQPQPPQPLPQQLQQRQIVMSMSPVPAAATPPPPASRVLAMPPPPPPLVPSAPDRRIDIQPAEDESDAADDSVSVKHVARARYMRNHFLADKLFGEGDTVPDTRQIVTENKLRVLRRQVHSLTQYQSKLESELATMQEKHEERKRRFESSIATFEAEMKKHARKSIVVDEGMINKQLETLRQARTLTAPAASAAPCSLGAAGTTGKMGAGASTVIVTKGTGEAHLRVAGADLGASVTPTNA